MSNHPRPGLLRHRLSLEKPVAEPDGLGGQATRWEMVGELWAQIHPLESDMRLVAGALAQRNLHRVRIRYREDVRPGMRFRKNLRVFEIETVADSAMTRRYLECRVREVPEFGTGGAP